MPNLSNLHASVNFLSLQNKDDWLKYVDIRTVYIFSINFCWYLQLQRAR